MSDSFYTVNGDEISKESIVAEFINNYTGNLTDFNEGSKIRNLIEAFAVYAMGLEERLNDVLYIIDIMNADGEYLDLMASQPGIGMERITGVEATGYVVFSVANALLEELLIPEGTVVSADNGMDFETITDNILLPGETSMECMVEAIDVGVDGNISANSIVTKVDGYDAVPGFTVSNPYAFSGGLDYEEDDVFRDRILEHMSSFKFGSKPYYINKLVEEFPEMHDLLFDTTSQSYTAVVTPNIYGDSGGVAQATLVTDVMSWLSDPNNVMVNHSFNVVAPDAMSTEIYITSAHSLASRESDIVEVVRKFMIGGSLSFAPIDYPGLNLLETTSPSELKSVLQTVFGDGTIANVSMTRDGVFSTGKNKYEITSIGVQTL